MARYERLNIKVDVHSGEVLEQVMATHDYTPSEVIRRALALYGITEQVTADGGKVQLAHADGAVETLRLL